jgi:hypothetical protein
MIWRFKAPTLVMPGLCTQRVNWTFSLAVIAVWKLDSISLSVTANEKVQFTLWVHSPGITNVGALKRQIIPFLKQSHIWIERHSSPMNDVKTTIIGWYSNLNHPDTINFMTAQCSLNKKIQAYLATNKAHLVSYANDTGALPNWNGEYLPPVTLKLFKPDWKTVVNGQTQQWKTRATAVSTTHIFRRLMRHVMFELDECDHLGRKAFVDTAMRGVSDTIDEAYGKAIHNQQAYLRSTEY